MNFKKQFNAPQVSFQMAPMVDIIFQLLIFFMVATIFAQYETKVGITVPTADSGFRGRREFTELIINLDRDGLIFINNVEMLPERLESILGEVAKSYGEAPVIIRADGKTDHEHVIRVLDICRKVDIWNVAFATLPGAGAAAD